MTAYVDAESLLSAATTSFAATECQLSQACSLPHTDEFYKIDKSQFADSNFSIRYRLQSIDHSTKTRRHT
jgi:hypothetical protein